MKDIKIGSTVACPITDSEGENSYRMGKLVKINSRFATVETSDGETFRVGKTKIELVEAPKVSKPEKVKEEFIMPTECPHCGIDLDNGISCHSDRDVVNGKLISHDQFEYACLGCGEEFGPKIEKHGLARAADYDYQPCVAASGKKSKDNNDAVAQELRGQTLDFAYSRAAEYLQVSEDSLRAQYKHLNPGQQRMCLGNRIRGAK